jgi:hypothetical protein
LENDIRRGEKKKRTNPGSSNISGEEQSIVTTINRIIAMNNRRCDAGRPWYRSPKGKLAKGKNGEPAQAL